MSDAPWYVLLTLFCVPAPVVGVALVARTRRLSWRRALFGAWLAQGVLILALVVRAHTGMEGCARNDTVSACSWEHSQTCNETDHARDRAPANSILR